MDHLPDTFVKAVVSDYGVSLKELDVLLRALHGSSMCRIAQDLHLNEELVRKRLSDIYRKLQVPGRGPVKFQKLKDKLTKLYQDRSNSVNRESYRINIDGRQAEVSQLKQWILNDQSQLIAIIGVEGIGKTELARQIYHDQSIQSQFDHVIWESLRYRPLMSDMIGRLLQKLQLEPDLTCDYQIERNIERLIDYCYQHRCLLILDQMDTIIEDRQMVGTFRPDYQPYRYLIQDFSQGLHHSCLLLTSRCQFPQIAALEEADSMIRTLELKGLSIQDARPFLQKRRLSDEDKWPILVGRYSGHPEQLKFASSYIREVFNGSVAAFLDYNQDGVIRDIAVLLDKQLQCLSDLEHQVIEMIAQSQFPVSLDQIATSLKALISANQILNPAEVWSAVQSLKRRALITLAEDQSGFVLQHPIMANYISCRSI